MTIPEGASLGLAGLGASPPEERALGAAVGSAQVAEASEPVSFGGLLAAAWAALAAPDAPQVSQSAPQAVAAEEGTEGYGEEPNVGGTAAVTAGTGATTTEPAPGGEPAAVAASAAPSQRASDRVGLPTEAAGEQAARRPPETPATSRRWPVGEPPLVLARETKAPSGAVVSTPAAASGATAQPPAARGSEVAGQLGEVRAPASAPADGFPVAAGDGRGSVGMAGVQARETAPAPAGPLAGLPPKTDAGAGADDAPGPASARAETAAGERAEGRAARAETGPARVPPGGAGEPGVSGAAESELGTRAGTRAAGTESVRTEPAPPGDPPRAVRVDRGGREWAEKPTELKAAASELKGGAGSGGPEPPATGDGEEGRRAAWEPDAGERRVGRGPQAEPAPTPTREEAARPLPRAELRDLPQSVRRAELAAEAGKPAELRLQLVPEHLGRLSLRITVAEGGVTARMLVETPEVKVLIEQRLPELERALREQGLRLESVSVGCAGQEAGDSRFFRQESREEAVRGLSEGLARRWYEEQPSGGPAGALAPEVSHLWSGSGTLVDALV